MDYNALLKKFDEIYHYLYLQNDAKNSFSEFCENDKNLQVLRAFVRERGDAVTSDREAAAFMLALEFVENDNA